MMLLIPTSVLGYELKTAVGTSVFIMTFTGTDRGSITFCDRWLAGRDRVDPLHCLYPDLGADRLPFLQIRQSQRL